MARNWLRLRQASFRGARFHVDEDGPDRGRRVAVHDISGGETPVTEDMGRLATGFSVTAYVAGDQADAVGHALERACDLPGPALLVLPIDAARMVHCTGCSRSREKDRSGYISYHLEFVEAGVGAVGGGGLGVLRSVFAAGLAALAGAMS
nr:DNA circularization N-terminal domain-containing protein [Mesorhizobium sp.]